MAAGDPREECTTLYNIGTTGFEPMTTRFQSEDSDQTELRPVHMF